MENLIRQESESLSQILPVGVRDTNQCSTI